MHKCNSLNEKSPAKALKNLCREAFTEAKIALKIRFVQHNKKNKKNSKKVLTKEVLSCIIRIVVRDTKNFTK